MGLLVFGVIVVLVVFWIIGAYNGLIVLKNRVLNAWKQIDVQLKRRHDLIPNLVATVKDAMEPERDAPERVMNARSRAMAAPSLTESIAAEGELSRALRQLIAVVENYPALRSNENVLKLQEELTTTENQLGFARQFYNDVTMRFNTQQEVFPSSIIASFFAFQPAALFAAEEQDRDVPQINLSLRASR